MNSNKEHYFEFDNPLGKLPIRVIVYEDELNALFARHVIEFDELDGRLGWEHYEQYERHFRWNFLTNEIEVGEPVDTGIKQSKIDKWYIKQWNDERQKKNDERQKYIDGYQAAMA